MAASTVQPTTIAAGDPITLMGGCALDDIAEVLVCDVPCPITSRTSQEIVCTPMASGTCEVRGVSGSGEFVSNTLVTIMP